MKLSNHAYERAQQRGISQREMQILMEFGDEMPAGSGATVFCVNSKQTRREVQSLWTHRPDFDLESVVGGYLVVRNSDFVLTTGHRRARFKQRWCSH